MCVDWSWCDAVTAMTALIGVVGGGGGALWTYKQWRHEQNLKRAESLKNLLDDFEKNTVRAVICSSDDDTASNRLFVEAEKDEVVRREIEKSLDFFSYLCYLRECNLITSIEFGFFERQLEKVLADRSVQEYLEQSRMSEDGRFRHLIEHMDVMQCESNSADEPLSANGLEEIDQSEINNKDTLTDADFTEPTLLVRLKNADGRKPEDAANGWWKVSRESVEGLKYAVVAIDGVVCGVYSITGWQKYGEETSSMADNEHGVSGIPGRLKFSIASAPSEVKSRYMDKSVKNLFSKGAVNPIRYFGMHK